MTMPTNADARYAYASGHQRELQDLAMTSASPNATSISAV